MTQTPVRNRAKDRLDSDLHIGDFAAAMRSLDLTKVSPENRNAAIREHLTRIMAMHVTSSAARTQLGEALVMNAATKAAQS